MIPITPPPPALVSTTERDMQCIRPLTEAEMVGCDIIVAWDVNASYLAACSSLQLGVGEAVHRGPSGGVDVNPRSMGPLYASRGEGWETSPTLRWRMEAHRLDHMIVAETWEWKRWERPLESWYRTLRDARTVALLQRQPIHRALMSTIKLMYAGLLGGRVASKGWDREGDPLYRPDWRHFVIAQARDNLNRAIARLPSARPFAIATDCLFFAANSTEPPEGLRVGTSPGTFKFAGKLLMREFGRAGLRDLQDALHG